MKALGLLYPIKKCKTHDALFNFPLEGDGTPFHTFTLSPDEFDLNEGPDSAE